jgi:LPS-assembly lipoprotein
MIQPTAQQPHADRMPQSRRRFGVRVGGMALLVLASSLAGCGFQLRKAPDFAFKSIYTGAALGNELRRNLAAMGNIQLITDAAQAKNAQVILDILQEQREKTVVGMTASGQVREFQLRLRIRFRLYTPQGKELIPDTELLQQRDISFNESAVLSKEAEEGLLYRNMQTDIVQQLMRRLAAVKEL